MDYKGKSKYESMGVWEYESVARPTTKDHGI